jgi:hypothetical protein
MVMQMSKCRHYGKTDIYCSNAWNPTHKFG